MRVYEQPKILPQLSRIQKENPIERALKYLSKTLKSESQEGKKETDSRMTSKRE